MALTRTVIANELIARVSGSMIAAGLLATDTTGNLKEPIDDAVRLLGVPFADVNSPEATLTESDFGKVMAAGTVFALRRALDAASGLADIAAGELNVAKKQSQIVANLRARLNDAMAVAAQYSLFAANEWQTGVVLLGSVEVA